MAEGGPKKHPLSVLGPRQQADRRDGEGRYRARSSGGIAAGRLFPACAASPTGPTRRRAVGLSGIGLPFESDTAVTRHLAAFLTRPRQRQASRCGRRTCCSTAASSRPTRFAAGCSRCLASWAERFDRPKRSGRRTRSRSRRRPRRGLLRLGQAARRRADSRRHGPLVLRRHRNGRPGHSRRAAAAAGAVRRAVRHGGRHEIDVPSDEFGLVVGEPATFRFFSSAVRKADKPGDLLDRWTEDELVRNRFARSHCCPRTTRSKTTSCPSAFTSQITELGVFELWCQSTKSPNRWKLEFSVRKDAD